MGTTVEEGIRKAFTPYDLKGKTIKNRFIRSAVNDHLGNVDGTNETTKTAIEEARSGKLRDVPSIDASSVEAMFKSMG